MPDTYVVAVPSEGEGGLEANRSAHFGHCGCFTLVEVSNGEVTGVRVIPNVAHEHGGCLGPVELLASNGAHAIVAVGMGARPLAGFAERGIDVLYDPESPRVDMAIARLLSGNAVVMGIDNSCGCH